MNYEYKTLPGESTVVLTFYEDFNFKTDLAKTTPEAIAMLNGLNKPVFWVVHILGKLDVEDLLLATKDVSQGPDAVWRHPMIREVVVISSDLLVQAAAPGFDTEAFGNLKIQVFADLDQALAYVRSQQGR